MLLSVGVVFEASAIDDSTALRIRPPVSSNDIAKLSQSITLACGSINWSKVMKKIIKSVIMEKTKKC